MPFPIAPDETPRSTAFSWRMTLYAVAAVVLLIVPPMISRGENSLAALAGIVAGFWGVQLVRAIRGRDQMLVLQGAVEFFSLAVMVFGGLKLGSPKSPAQLGLWAFLGCTITVVAMIDAVRQGIFAEVTPGPIFRSRDRV